MKNKKTLFKTLFILFIVKYSVLGVLLFAGAKKYIYSANVELFTHELSSNAKLIMPLIQEFVSQKKYPQLADTIKDMAYDSNKRITVTDISGNVLADSQNDASDMTNHLGRDEIKAVVEGESFGRSIRYSTTLQENMLYWAVPVKVDGKTSAVLRLSVAIKKINLFTNSIFKSLAVVFVFVGVVALIAAYFISKKVSAGVSRLSKAALEVASGKFGAKADIRSDDEIGSLAQSFNKMSDEIRVLFKEVNDGKEMLDKVLSSVSDGILLIDKDGKAIMFNEAFKNIFPDVMEERYFWEFLRSKDIEASLQKMKSSSGENLLSGEFSHESSVFSFVFSKVKNEDKFVISVKDVTKIKQLDKFKKDFITNASHELKTPVTAIIGFSETLETEELSDENKHYVDVIKKQAQRLSNIVNDLLSLSSFENIKEIEKKDINIIQIIDNVSAFYKKKAAEKGITIRVNTDARLHSIFANEFNIEQVLVNIVDNAVKYTEKGEITINAVNEGAHIAITVSDTGIGIPKEHISRLFERFYVVDKSRSKKSGGTGLGLSIVKHIVQAHYGTISIESFENRGSKFIIKFPVVVK